MIKWISVLFISLIYVQASAKMSLDVTKYKLKNGLTVLLHKDDKIPLYSLQMWYKVGSHNEDPDLTGLAHFFEHLMFKGTKNHPDGYFDNFIETNGGMNNAFTNRDMTVYYEDMPTDTLAEIVELEADRMTNLKITKSNIKSEREVVKEERRLRVENSPYGRAFEALYTESYPEKHFYQWPVIGSMKHLEEAKLSDFKNFYKKFYSPNNVILVLVGNFNKKQAKSLIQKEFGDLKASELPPVQNVITEYKTSQYKKITMPMNSKFLLYSLPGVKVKDKERLSLNLIHTILTSGETSFLHQTFVENKKLALNVGSSNSPLKHGGLQYLYLSLKPGQSAQAAHKELKSQLKAKVKKGINDSELLKAKKKFKLSYYDQFKTLSDRARLIGEAELYYGDYTVPFDYDEIVESLDVEEINRVFRKYFDVNKLNFIEVGK